MHTRVCVYGFEMKIEPPSSSKSKSAFECYYDLFRLDPRQIWVIILLDGTKRIGTVNASSVISMACPLFMFHDGRRNVSIPFSTLKHAETIDSYYENNKSDKLASLIEIKKADYAYIHAAMREINDSF
jgi:hypothetical protein